MENRMILTGQLTALRLGRPTTSDKYDVSGFFVDASETAGITAGSFLAYGATHKNYTKIKSTTTAAQVAGVFVDSLGKQVRVYPAASGLDQAMPGEVGDVLIRGDIAVEGVANANPAEGAPVFLGLGADVLGKVTTAIGAGATLAIALPNFVFLGVNVDSQGKRLCAVRKLY